jgi:hypothetical protein
MKNRWAILTAVFCGAIASAAFGQTTVLYNGAAGAGNETPQSQGWLGTSALGGTPVVSSSGGKTSFDTTGSSTIEAGYSNYNILPTPSLVNSSFPALNPTTGFTVDLTMQLNSESHSNNNRAGFSLIALGSDGKGIEIGFWTPIVGAVINNIWVQGSSSFTQAEGTIFDDSSASHNYQLSILGGNYSLFADGSKILNGSTRDYSAAAIPPYTLDNYVFIGDDTTSAAASEQISYLAVTVPEPVTGAIAIFGIAIALFVRPRRIAI